MAARPRYRRNMKTNQEKKKLGDDDNNDLRIKRESSLNMKLVSERSRTLRKAIQQYKPVQARHLSNTNNVFFFLFLFKDFIF